MTTATMVIGAILTLCGSGGYIVSSEPGTLVPMAFGLVLVILAFGARRSTWSPAIMHMVVGFTFVGMLASTSSVPHLIRMIGGAVDPHPATVVTTAILAVSCLIHVTMSMRWFLAKKRSEKS